MSERKVKINLRKVLPPIFVVVMVGILTLYLLAREQLLEMLNALQSASYSFIGLAIGVYVFSIALWATRWRIALSAIGHETRLRGLFATVWGSVFVNNLTPFTYSGGDPFARTYLLKKIARVPYSSGFAAAAGEFLLDLPIFLSFLAFGLLFSFGRVSTLPALFLLSSWIIVLLVVMPLLPRFLRGKAASGKITGIIWRITKMFRLNATKVKVSRGVSRFYKGAYSVVEKKRCVLSMTTIAALLWTFIIIRLFLIFQALGYSPPLQMLLLAATIPPFVGLVPLLPGGLGTVDTAFFLVYTGFGVPPGLAFSAILIDRAITYVFGTLVGGGALSYLGICIWTKKS